MKDGYIKVAAATPKVKVADTVYNGQLIKALMKAVSYTHLTLPTTSRV